MWDPDELMLSMQQTMNALDGSGAKRQTLQRERERLDAIGTFGCDVFKCQAACCSVASRRRTSGQQVLANSNYWGAPPSDPAP